MRLSWKLSFFSCVLLPDMLYWKYKRESHRSGYPHNNISVLQSNSRQLLVVVAAIFVPWKFDSTNSQGQQWIACPSEKEGSRLWLYGFPRSKYNTCFFVRQSLYLIFYLFFRFYSFTLIFLPSHHLQSNLPFSYLYYRHFRLFLFNLSPICCHCSFVNCLGGEILIHKVGIWA